MPTREPEGTPQCSVEGCERPKSRREWCKMHYQRWYRNGDPLWVPMTREQRIDSHIDRQPGGCWLWTAAVNDSGYGVTTTDGARYAMAHRAVYEIHVGPIPEGLHLDHTCHTMDSSCAGGLGCPHRRCVNPEHLEPVTPQENNRRSLSLSAQNATKTHCPQGHEYSEANTYRRDGRRECRSCHAERERQRKARLGKRKVS